MRSFFNIYLDVRLSLPMLQIGTIMGTGQFIPLFIALVTPAILARWGATWTFALVMFGTGVALVTLAVMPLWPAAALSFMGMLCMAAIREPTRKLFSQEIVAPRWRTTTSAIGTIGVALGWASAAGIGGHLITAVGFSGLFLLGAVLAFVASFALLGYQRTQVASGEVPALD